MSTGGTINLFSYSTYIFQRIKLYVPHFLYVCRAKDKFFLGSKSPNSLNTGRANVLLHFYLQGKAPGLSIWFRNSKQSSTDQTDAKSSIMLKKEVHPKSHLFLKFRQRNVFSHAMWKTLCKITAMHV